MDKFLYIKTKISGIFGWIEEINDVMNDVMNDIESSLSQIEDKVNNITEELSKIETEIGELKEEENEGDRVQTPIHISIGDLFSRRNKQ